MAAEIQLCSDGRVKLCPDGRVLLCPVPAPCECPSDLDDEYIVNVEGEPFTVTKWDPCLWATGAMDPPVNGIVDVTLALFTSEPCHWRIVVGFDDFTTCRYEKHEGLNPTGEYDLKEGGCGPSATVEESAP